MADIDPATVIARQPVHASRVADDLVLFDEAAGRYFATGSVGADIWDLIATPQRLDAICTALVARYEVDPATCAAEVSAFVAEMVAAGLVELR
jgi:hypothetical protein